MLKIGWAYHNGRPAPRQQDWNNPITMSTPKDEQKEYKFTTKIGQFFEELKVQSRTKIDNQRLAKIKILLAKKCVENYSQEYLYPKSKILVSLMGHI